MQLQFCGSVNVILHVENLKGKPNILEPSSAQERVIAIRC
jgi:hypothetical protein